MRGFTDADRVVLRDPLFAERYGQVARHDGRFDGQYVTGLPMSGIFCLPRCMTRTARPSQIVFYPTAAAAHAAGLRPCPRCRPDIVARSPEMAYGDTVGCRALRLIDDGQIDRGGVGSVARRLGITARQVLRAVQDTTGCGPLDIARANRAHLARLLLASTTAPMQVVAVAAGFATVRQFNNTIRDFYDATPGELRPGGRRAADATADATGGPLVLRCELFRRQPFDARGLIEDLAERAVPELEECGHSWYARVVRLPYDAGHLRIDCDDGGRVLAKFTVADPRDLRPLYARTRRLLDLDADPMRTDRQLATDPLLADGLAAHPGVRVAGAVDPEEAVIRALVEDDLPLTSARTVLGGLTAALGDPTPWGPLFPTARQIADHGREVLRGEAGFVETVTRVATALATGRLVVHWGLRREQLRAALSAVPGIGPWAVETIVIRVLGERDVLLTSAEGVRVGARRVGLPTDSAALLWHAQRWSPAQSYAGALLHKIARDSARR